MYGYPNYLQNYQPKYQNNYAQQQQPQQNTSPQDERIWVQNETSAEAYLLAPNGFVRLWDSGRPVFYEKRADATGRPMPMRMFEYKEVSSMPESEKNDYVRTEEFTEFKEQVNSFIKSFESKEVKKNVTKSNGTNADA